MSLWKIDWESNTFAPPKDPEKHEYIITNRLVSTLTIEIYEYKIMNKLFKTREGGYTQSS